MRGGDYLPEYIGGYICGSIRAGKPCSYKQLGEMRTFRFIVNQKWIEAQSFFESKVHKEWHLAPCPLPSL